MPEAPSARYKVSSDSHPFTVAILRFMGLLGGFLGSAMLLPMVMSLNPRGGLLYLGLPIALAGALAFGTGADPATHRPRPAGRGGWFLFAVVCMVGGAYGMEILPGGALRRF